MKEIDRERETKHALIANTLFGRDWTPFEGEEFERLGWQASHLTDPGYEWGVRIAPPHFSSDLNLCALAEAKITEIGMIHDYIRYLENEIGHDFYLGRDAGVDVMKLVTASAEARVGAMVAVIQERAK